MTRYEQGFLTKCASARVPKNVAFALLKRAQEAGSQDAQLGSLDQAENDYLKQLGRMESLGEVDDDGSGSSVTLNPLGHIFMDRVKRMGLTGGQYDQLSYPDALANIPWSNKFGRTVHSVVDPIYSAFVSDPLERSITSPRITMDELEAARAAQAEWGANQIFPAGTRANKKIQESLINAGRKNYQNWLDWGTGAPRDKYDPTGIEGMNLGEPPEPGVDYTERFDYGSGVNSLTPRNIPKQELLRQYQNSMVRNGSGNRSGVA
jgi:hypothetical protein